MGPSVAVTAYLVLFVGVGFAFIFVSLAFGRFIRPSDPNDAKREIYECGEPPIGSSYVQFDLRFYVVALVFIIFDVEVAFLFPWATVFGKVNHLSRLVQEPSAVLTEADRLTVDSLYRELGVESAHVLSTDAEQVARSSASLALLAALAALIFFAVLLIGFAYEWKTGALDWIRAIAHERGGGVPTSMPATMQGSIATPSA